VFDPTNLTDGIELSADPILPGAIGGVLHLVRAPQQGRVSDRRARTIREAAVRAEKPELALRLRDRWLKVFRFGV